MQLSYRSNSSPIELLWFGLLMTAFLCAIGLIALRLFVPELFGADVQTGAEFGANSIVALVVSAGGLYLLARA